MPPYKLREFDWHNCGRKIQYTAACWNWTAARDKRGYGRVAARTADNRQVTVFAHRLMWHIANCRPVPAGMSVLHSCDNPSCVRPDHLRLGTHAENMQDMKDRGRGLGRHPMAPEKAPHAKLTWESVRAIRALAALQPQLSKRAMARVFGITRGNIAFILAGRTWREPATDPQETPARRSNDASGARAAADRADGTGPVSARGHSGE